ncbi:hypothetical protein [Nannocystis punicea]|uniref:Uncharacterized protein n=1 Tax=Nannocystis punicea TaxID=2995304 RepID=A0ABY7H209_9BACT|nr:hypothetical protein [Nannocystis poenicansa]WAS93299.1 hypothetical protein O0S08_44710 [Nannocystis poenicansa]
MIDGDAQWSLARRLWLSFLGLYFCLNIVPLMVLSVPLVDDWFGMLWLTLWVKLMPILGNAALGIEEPISMELGGSTDMTWNYVQQFWYLVLATVGAVVWAILPHRKWPLPAQYAWLRIIVRHGLAMMMLSYGFIKVFGTQMPPLGPAELSRTYGESSAGGLLWSFMGFSHFYQGFTGMAEVIGGALLLWRRTATLGALVSAGVMAHVVVLNFCYGVGVKIYSSLFLALAVFLAAYHARPLVDLFVRGRPATLADPPPVLSRRMRIARIILKGVVFVSILETPVKLAIRQAAPKPAPGPLDGAWEVVEFVRDGQVHPWSQHDELRWRQLVIPPYPVAMVRGMRGQKTGFGMALDEAAGTMTLTSFADPKVIHALALERPAADELILRGPIAGAEVTVRLQRLDTEHAPLMTRGFRWVIEEGFN